MGHTVPSKGSRKEVFHFLNSKWTVQVGGYFRPQSQVAHVIQQRLYNAPSAGFSTGAGSEEGCAVCAWPLRNIELVLSKIPEKHQRAELCPSMDLPLPLPGGKTPKQSLGLSNFISSSIKTLFCIDSFSLFYSCCMFYELEYYYKCLRKKSVALFRV